MDTFAPVWVSSRDHLRDFVRPYLGTSWFRRYLWPPDPPPGFPQIRLGSRAFPLVLFATGELEIDANKITFSARHEPRYKNVDDELEFELLLDRRTGIDRFFMESALIKRFSWSWIALRSPELDDEILLCVGGTGLAVARMKEQTEELYRALLEAKSE